MLSRRERLIWRLELSLFKLGLVCQDGRICRGTISFVETNDKFCDELFVYWGID